MLTVFDQADDVAELRLVMAEKENFFAYAAVTAHRQHMI